MLTDQEPIMPTPSVVGGATWEIETLEAQHSSPDPGPHPGHCLFIPSAMRNVQISPPVKWADRMGQSGFGSHSLLCDLVTPLFLVLLSPLESIFA